MKRDFIPAVKSTIDYIGSSLAIAESLSFVDLDDKNAVEALLHSEDNAIVWSLGPCRENPKDPLYKFSFAIGARTVNDSGNYKLTDLVGEIVESFTVSESFKIYNYAVAVLGNVVGTAVVSEVGTEDQMYEERSGLRMTSIVCNAFRNF